MIASESFYTANKADNETFWKTFLVLGTQIL